MQGKLRLSEAAVALLHFKTKGLKVPVTEQRLPAFRELVDAGIMESIPGPVGTPEADFRFTAEGLKNREDVLRAEGDRIERERFAPPDTNISEAARETLRHYLSGDRKVTEANLAAYRELAAARIMIPLHGFVGGWETAFRLTYWGAKRGFELVGMNGTVKANRVDP